MKKIFRFFTALIIISTLTFFSTNAFAFDYFVWVKFKKEVSKEFLSNLKKMTETDISQKIGTATYKFEIKRIGSKDLIDRYSELFSIMNNVESVNPLPKEKVSDRINPHFYINMSVQEIKNINNNTSGKQEVQDTQPQYAADEYIVKFNKDASQEDVLILNNGLGAEVIYQKETDSYKIKIPDYMDQEYVSNYYGNNRLVESIEPVKIINTPGPSSQPSVLNQKQEFSSNQSGIVVSFPLTGKDLKVTFKTGEEENGVKWFNEFFSSQIIEKKGFSSYILRFPPDINPKVIERALKLCPSVSNVQIFFN